MPATAGLAGDLQKDCKNGAFPSQHLLSGGRIRSDLLCVLSADLSDLSVLRFSSLAAGHSRTGKTSALLPAVFDASPTLC
jgi:hypothetical protein